MRFPPNRSTGRHFGSWVRPSCSTGRHFGSWIQRERQKRTVVLRCNLELTNSHKQLNWGNSEVVKVSRSKLRSTRRNNVVLAAALRQKRGSVLRIALATTPAPAETEREGPGYGSISEPKMAEEEGFEPSSPGAPVKRFSRPPHSTTLPPLRRGDAPPKGAPYQSEPGRGSRDKSGGEMGIRTPDTLLGHTRFPIVLLRPARTSLRIASASRT